MEADAARNQSPECQLLIVKAAKAAYNSIKDTGGATHQSNVCLWMSLWKISAAQWQEDAFDSV